MFQGLKKWCLFLLSVAVCGLLPVIATASIPRTEFLDSTAITVNSQPTAQIIQVDEPENLYLVVCVYGAINTHNGAPVYVETVWGLDLTGQRDGVLDQASAGIGGLLAIRNISGTTTNTYLPICDHNGNIHQVIGTNGAVVATYTYAPFGSLVVAYGTAVDVCPFRWASRYYDKNTELYYVDLRYVQPYTGKFISRDPLGEAGGVNLTAYCEGDPINKTDGYGTMGEGFIFGWASEQLETLLNNTQDSTKAFSGSMLQQSLQIKAGTDPLYTGYNDAKRAMDLIGERGLAEGGKAYLGEGWETLKNAAPVYGNGRKALDSNEETLARVGYAMGAVGDIASLLIPVKVKISAMRSARTAPAIVRPPPLRATPSVGFPARMSQLTGADIAGESTANSVKRMYLQTGEDVPVPAGTKGIRQMMADISAASGREVALLRLRDGSRVLRMGSNAAVPLGENVKMLIAHTHPSSRLGLSLPDRLAVLKRGGYSTVIIDPKSSVGVRLHIYGNH